jgi:PAS domain S-box-containing protein
MKEKRTGQEKFNPLWLKDELWMMNSGFAAPLVGLADPLKLIRDLQILRIKMEMQIKELLRSQKELMESKIRYTDLYDTALVGYFTLDLRGTILNANLTLADMLSMERPSLLNRHIMDSIFFEDHDIFYRHLKDLDTLKIRQVCELRMKKKDGRTFDVKMDTIRIADRCKGPEQYRSVVIDISARKKAAKEKEKFQAKLHQVHKLKSMETVSGGIAHNFNNIFHIILGNVELALDEVPKFNPAHANLKRIKSAALRASDMVKQLINFSHRKSEDLKPIDLVGIIKETLELIRPSIPATIELKEYFPEKEVTIPADPSQMAGILTHLCTNALQAMEGRKGQLCIGVETKTLTPEEIGRFSDLTPGEYGKITVRDTGVGIHPEIIDQIFDPYFTTRECGKGSGMGLAIVHSLVKNHNGNITVDSTPGKGTDFTLLFPSKLQFVEL